ncbi:MAG TPA: ATP-binding cassette domain-containing protein [Ktedonobacteraceae bacterium]
MLQVRQLEKLIDGRSVLSIEQLDIDAEQIVAVVGSAGSGKTLLVRLLTGVQIPSGGTVLLDGQDIHRVEAVRSRIGVLFEEDLLYKRQSARQNLEFYRRLRGLSRESVDAALALVSLNDQAEKAVSKLSSSSQRRLALARAMMGQPSVLLLDQPVLRTDMETQNLFTRLILQAASKGVAILVTAEDLAWVGRCCTRVVELENGRVLHSHDYAQSQEESRSERLIPYKVSARREDRVVLFDPGDILYATSRDGKTFLRTANEEATTNLTLQELENLLVGRGFFKAHRAYLVNLQHIKAVIQYTRNSYTLQLSDPQESMIPLSKQCEKELQALLGY